MAAMSKLSYESRRLADTATMDYCFERCQLRDLGCVKEDYSDRVDK
jgi:hypothetical protein